MYLAMKEIFPKSDIFQNLNGNPVKKTNLFMILDHNITRYMKFKIFVCKHRSPSSRTLSVGSGRDLTLGRRCTQYYTCDALSGHSLSLLLGGVPVNPRC